MHCSFSAVLSAAGNHGILALTDADNRITASQASGKRGCGGWGRPHGALATGCQKPVEDRRPVLLSCQPQRTRRQVPGYLHLLGLASLLHLRAERCGCTISPVCTKLRLAWRLAVLVIPRESLCSWSPPLPAPRSHICHLLRRH